MVKSMYTILQAAHQHVESMGQGIICSSPEYSHNELQITLGAEDRMFSHAAHLNLDDRNTKFSFKGK